MKKISKVIVALVIALIPIGINADNANVTLECKGTNIKIEPGSEIACSINVFAGNITVEEFEAKVDVVVDELSIENFKVEKGLGDDLGVPRGDTDERPTISVAGISSNGTFTLGTLNFKINENIEEGKKIEIKLDKITINEDKNNTSTASTTVQLYSETNNYSENGSEKTDNIINNPKTGSLALIVVGVLLVVSLSLIFYINYKRKKDDN